MPFSKYSPEVKELIISHALHSSSFQELRNLTPHQNLSRRSMAQWLVLNSNTGKPFQNLAGYLKRGHHNCFDKDELLVFQDIVMHNLGMYLVEIKKKMLDITGKEVSVETIRHDLHNCLRLTLVKPQGVDPQQSAEDRAAYITHIAGVQVEYLVFIGKFSVFLFSITDIPLTDSLSFSLCR
ncbi:hypothetical protein CROQUDRAFT_45600 [Cronartium quercuum f. sp. fusiforme G11]|uniref:Uncharacterized protein n=1 Tax=Cronartium quercuum f. sp. fusiforme G11 TaxID=708437 RepID=A0A9P6NEX6_9BASI|nr:hypothetical protein CROQUDRAFT_45600 [Cronartium quercuum f. sp. fusiforme G11]